MNNNNKQLFKYTIYALALFFSIIYTYIYVTSSLYFIIFIAVITSIFMILQSIMNKSTVLGIINVYLFISVLSCLTLLRSRTIAIDEPVILWITYSSFVFISATIWTIASTIITGNLLLKHSSIKHLIKILPLIGMLLSTAIYLLIVPFNSVNIFELLSIFLLSLLMASIIWFFDQLLFHRAIKLAKHIHAYDADKFVYTLILIILFYALALVTTMLPGFHPSERPFLALGIAYTYYYSGQAMVFVAQLFLNHGIIVEEINASKTIFLERSLVDYYRLRYLASLVNLFNHLEYIGSKGQRLLSKPLEEALKIGYNNLPKQIKEITIFRKILKLLNEINNTYIIRLRKEIYDYLIQLEDRGKAAKTVETFVLELYRNMTRKEKTSTLIKQFRGELKHVIKQLRDAGIQVEPIEKLLDNLYRPSIDKIEYYIEFNKLTLRDLRNFIVHGRLSRELVMYKGEILEYIPFTIESDKLYLITTCLLVLTTFYENNYARKKVNRK